MMNWAKERVCADAPYTQLVGEQSELNSNTASDEELWSLFFLMFFESKFSTVLEETNAAEQVSVLITH